MDAEPDRGALRQPRPAGVPAADPRQGGQGNWLNQGLASIIWPVGTVNAGDPDRARDGTGLALRSALAAADPAAALPVFVDTIRRAWLPYAGLPPERLAVPDPETRELSGTNVGLPSRVQALENVVAAFAALKYGQGDFNKTFRAALFYGRDAESIAAVAVALLGAMQGPAIVPAGLRGQVDRANRRDFAAQATAFAAAAAWIVSADDRLQRCRTAAVLAPHRTP